MRLETLPLEVQEVFRLVTVPVQWVPDVQSPIFKLWPVSLPLQEAVVSRQAHMSQPVMARKL